MINKVNLNNISACGVNRSNTSTICSKNNLHDSVSFKGDITHVIISNNPNHAKQLMLIPINNYSARAKGIFAKAMAKVFKFMLAVAEPNAILKDANTRTFMAVKDNKITGGIIGTTIPHRDYFKCLTMAFDTSNQSKKEGIKFLYSIADVLCNYCEKENIHNISWMANPVNKSQINMYKKFASYDNKSSKYTVSVDRLKEFLDDSRKKHPKIFK